MAHAWLFKYAYRKMDFISSSHAHEHVGQLIDEFSHEADPGLRCWLLELLAEARNPNILSLFLEYLQSDESRLRMIAVHGLKQLNTKEARRALWEAGA